MRFIVLVGATILLGGCFHEFDTSEGKSRLVKAEHRAIISVKRPLIGSDGRPLRNDNGGPVTSLAVCAEPSPDALLATAVTLKGNLSEKAVKDLFSYRKSETPEYVGLRTQTIQLLRDAYFRLCEAFLNDGVDAIAYDILQRRFQSQIVALLAVEQLTGAVTARHREAPPKAGDIASALENSEKKLLDLQKEQEEIAEELDRLRGTNPPNQLAIKAAERRKKAIDDQIARWQTVIERLKAKFRQVVQGTYGTENSAGAGSQSSGAAVANAVRAITLNAINRDYEAQVCFETLRFHNNSSQFRNDVNNAFDSAGLEVDLKGGGGNLSNIAKGCLLRKLHSGMRVSV